MAYFLSSFLQKHVLKYALSRLGLVDTEALDPDNLGIRWGQRSTVELRDIGLKLEVSSLRSTVAWRGCDPSKYLVATGSHSLKQKLATLLNLPPACELLSARVQLLRLIIPADILSSGIICEASGINVHLRFLSEEPTQGNHEKAKFQTGSSGHAQGLPTPSNLAESFLETEPKEEKEELQAAISSQSRVLQRNSSFDEEEEEDVGLGNETMSLPSVLAGFLKGVGDRLQLKIKDVAVRVDMELKHDVSTKRQPEHRPDHIAGVLNMREINIHGVSGFTAGPDESLPHRESRRLISLVDINLGLVSSPVVFANYSRFAAPESPTTTMQSKESQSSSRAPSPPPFDHSSSDQDLAMTQSTIFEPSLRFAHESIADHRMGASAISHDGRFSDADSEEEHRHGDILDESRDFDRNDPFLDDHGYLDSVIDTQFDDLDLDSRPTMQLQTQPMADSVSDPDKFMRSSQPAENQVPFEGFETEPGSSSLHESQVHSSSKSSQVGFEAGGLFQPLPSIGSNQGNSTPTLHGSRTDSQPSAPPSDSGSTPSESGMPGADLMESKHFSHDEAQSLYMSAISHGTGESFVPNMPGAWESSDTGRQAAIDSDPAHRIDEALSRHETEDEANASTPKITGPSGSYFGGSQSSLGEKDDSQSPSPGKGSTTSSHVLHNMAEVKKSILNIDQIFIWLPCPTGEDIGSSTPQTTTKTGKNESRNSFSSLQETAVEGSTLSPRLQTSSRLQSGISDASTPFDREPPPHTSNQSQYLEIEVFSVTIHFDIAIGWLLIKIGQSIASALDQSEKTQPRQSSSSQKENQTALDLSVKNLSVKFLEHVAGQPHFLPSDKTPSPPPYASIQDIILQARASGFKIRLFAREEKTNLKLDIAKFVFGFASDDLISFNESLKMRESTRDVQGSSQGDISLSMVKCAESGTIDIITLPLHINLNIQRLEEVLGWMGGLSTILELGNSISSTSTMKGAGPKPQKKRTRGVHFEAEEEPGLETDSSASAPWKVNARVGGIVLDIVGETHYLKLSTTAVKAIKRHESFAVQIDKAGLLAPLPLDDFDEAPAKVTLTNIRVEFLFAPIEVDLDRLLNLITPSKDKYDEYDEIVLDTLLRQRRQGSVLRTTVTGVRTTISNTSALAPLSSLGHELSRLSNVTKYLPEDDRPGILTLTMIRELEVQTHLGGQVGTVNANLADFEAAWISMPSLFATQIGAIAVDRNDEEELIGEALVSEEEQTARSPRPPVIMARFIPDEMDPTFKVKLHHLRVEYTIPSIMAFLGLGQDSTGGDVVNEMAHSIVNLTENSTRTTEKASFSTHTSDLSRQSTKPTRLAVGLRNCVLGLNPRNCPSKGLVVLTNAKFGGTMHGDESSDTTLDIRKASIMVIDDVRNEGNIDSLPQRALPVTQSRQVQAYIDLGYVSVSSISSATAVVKLVRLADGGNKSLDIELRDNLLILETCADSTQTLIGILNGLQPPMPPSATAKYRTEVMPIQDMLASFTGDAFASDSEFPVDQHIDTETNTGQVSLEDQLSDELEYVSDFPGRQGNAVHDGDLDLLGTSQHDLLDSFHSQCHVSSDISELNFEDDHFAKKSAVGGTAHRWDSTHNTYGLPNDTKLQRSPLRVRVRDMHVIWNLFDGYDWQRTRDTISKAVQDVETKASERRARASRMSPGFDDDEESVIGDFLFNSIYIGVPANKDPRDLRREINQEINDLTSETDHKMTFELKGVCADLVVFPPDSEETQSSLDVRVRDLEIFDHLPTSTWKKFASYMHEAGERESGTSMLHLEILTVKPIPELAASEIVLKATVLPLRLIVDQDALDFMSRFFEFRDESVEAPSTPGDVPFLQRVEVNAVQVKLDFKPKRVDYAGLRSGRTTEFMNFFVLDGADMVLRHVIIYGVSGFDRLGNTLNDIWMPDVKRNQLPGVLAGLAPIRSLVNVGGGVRDLVVVPMREYKKDGRIVRSIQKGALAFAKTTSNELVKLGAKLAIGTQTVLQGAEDLLTSPNAASAIPDEDREDEEARQISLYADQPLGVGPALRSAFKGLERDLVLARDAIIAVPGEVVESGSASAAARAVWRRAPTLIFRPAIGVTKAVGQTLLGAGNTLDPSNLRKVEDKYKRH
ncbi:hypothetical protein N7492_009063 [Penicillium capsulatum]|uniref:Autophagy-related protein 2 n=1 Tax=Penicillium capsulatum TaxID=69766 RepID=A0A9W9HTX7_9EURO|nr:hypothetical protein N7492_009063 [Penicillium capsulatum]